MDTARCPSVDVHDVLFDAVEELHRPPPLLAATHNELVDRVQVVLETGLIKRDRLVLGLNPATHQSPLIARYSKRFALVTP